AWSMDLSLSEEQQLITDSAATFLAEASAMPAVRAASQSAEGLDRDLWRDMAELGWCGVHLPVTAGGLGLGLVELVLLQEQLGRRLACVPFFDSVALAATALRELPESPVAQDWLQQLAAGQAIAALALPTGPADGRASAQATDAGWVLQGDWPRVGSAAMADVLLLPTQTAVGESLLFAVSANAPGLQVQPLAMLDATRCMAAVQVDAVVLPATACIGRGEQLDSLLTCLQQLGAIALAAEQVGVAQQCLDLTLAYAAQRSQFGRPIASFQAVKHRCAQMLVALESARSAVYGAACIADTAPDAQALLFHAAQAHVAATEAAQFCAREAIQLHGGVGFTWEFDPHLYFRRAQASSQRLGAPSWWLEQVARQLLDTPEETV
ncbi:MAG: acyl-CoA dehydrogenase, partial [Variovorax sp.]|nr:acyl-CoA dehydrogenase [Variovorax sp.]